MMAGGGGSSRYYTVPSGKLEEKILEAQNRERQRLDGDVNALLNELLVDYNNRDKELTKERLNEIGRILAETVEFDRFLFGGSVAKRTEVNGLSDIDALVILDRDDLHGANSEQLKDELFSAMNSELSRTDVAKITVGRLAVTVRYDDGMEIQLLPAVKMGDVIAVPSGRSGTWIETEPAAFRRALTDANARLGGGLVPTIKLLKAALAKFPEQKRLSGYHVEALAVESAKNYNGPTTPKALLLHLLEGSAERVLTPITDKTGQSRTIDAYLGQVNSLERRNIALALDGLRRRLAAATSVAEWRSVLEPR